MEEYCRGAMLGLVSGMVIGGIIIAKNKSLASKIRKGLGIAEEKMQEAKEFIEEKIEETKMEFESKGVCDDCCDDCSDEKSNFDKLKDSSNKDFAKKSKN